MKEIKYPCVVVLTNDYDSFSEYVIVTSQRVLEHFEENNYVRLASDKEIDTLKQGIKENNE